MLVRLNKESESRLSKNTIYNDNLVVDNARSVRCVFYSRM